MCQSSLVDFDKIERENGLVIKSNSKGRAVYTTRELSRGTILCSYPGELISAKEGYSRESPYLKKNPNMLNYLYWFDANGEKLCYDATEETGGVGRLINHSIKNPNLVTKVSTNGPRPVLYFVAIKNILPDTELLYNYGETRKDVIQTFPWLKDS